MQSNLDGIGSRTTGNLQGNVSAITAMSGFKPIVKPGDELGKKNVEPDRASMVNAVKKLNDYVAPALQTVQFSIDDDTDRIVVKVVDSTTQQVLRQIPNEEVLAISKTLDKLQGLVIRQTA